MGTMEPICYDERKCFGQAVKRGETRCTVLTETYEFGICPFAKEKRGITNGKIYDYKKPR